MSAPSGYGKTTAVANWAETTSATVAWLTLGRYDAEPGRLTQGLTQALLAAREPLGAKPLGLDLHFDVDDPGYAYRAICDAFQSVPEPVVLVVDDAQRAGEDWSSGLLGALLEQRPDQLSIVVVGRVPVQGMLSRFLLTDPDVLVGADTLAFDAAEVEQLLGPASGGPSAEAVLRATGGWPIAVRLRSLGGADPDSTGDLGSALLRDYVRDHVLGSLPDRLSSFILDSAVCDDLTAGLARAVTGAEDASALLDECARLGLFLQRFDTGNGSLYRWHPVFARQCIAIGNAADPAHVRELHRRAARALRAKEPLTAMSHARRAGDTPWARQILLHSWIGLIVGPYAPAVETMAAELAAESMAAGSMAAGSMAAEPAVKVCEGDLELSLVRACALDVLGQHAVAREMFIRAEAALPATGRTASQEAVLGLARLFVVDGRAAAIEAGANVRRLLERPDALGSIDRAAVFYLLGWTELRYRTNATLLIEYFTVAAREAQVAGDVELARRSLGHLAFSLVWAGRITEADEVLQRLDAESLAASPWDYYAGGSAMAAAAHVAYWRGDLVTAQREYARVIGSGSSSTSFAGVARMMLAFAASESGDLAACRRAAIEVEKIPLVETHGVSWPLFREVSVAMLEDAAGNRERAVSIARKHFTAENLPGVCVALSGILRRNGDPAAALTMLRRLRGFADVSQVKVATLMTAAILKRERGDLDGAHALCESALEIAAAEQLRNPFGARETAIRSLLREHIARSRYQDFIASCLASPAAAGGLDSLTERERDVFRQLQTSRTLAEIAQDMHLSVNTIKTHARSIYRKLGVASRREATRIGN